MFEILETIQKFKRICLKKYCLKINSNRKIQTEKNPALSVFFLPNRFIKNIQVLVKPNAKSNSWGKDGSGQIWIRIAAPPTEGKANA